jgi:hypothetical protein
MTRPHETSIDGDLIGAYVRVPSWKAEGIIIDQYLPWYGPEGTVRFLLQKDPDDEIGQVFQCEPSQFEILIPA